MTTSIDTMTIGRENQDGQITVGGTASGLIR